MKYAYLGIVSLLFWYCTDNTATDIAKENTQAVIATQIVQKSCALSGCHLSNTDPSFLEHGLVLNNLQELVNRIPKNPTALEEGLKLIVPYDAENSLLYQKLLFETSNKSQKNFGSSMPLGNDLLTKGEIEFIKRWINAGAPATGKVADIALLEDKSPAIAKFDPLASLEPSQGYQVKLEPFEIFPNFEREIFVRKELGNEKPVYVNKFQLKMHPGSHHFILYGFRNNTGLPPVGQMRDLRYRDGSYNISTFGSLSNHVFYFGGSESNFTFNFPEGTAVELPANMSFDVNSHYFNKGSKSYNGEVYMNLHTVSESEVKKKLKVLDLANTSFVIPAKSKRTVSKDFTFAKKTNIVTLFSHTHRLGEKFEILIKGGPRNGEVIYTSINWEHPKKIDFASPIVLKAGEGLTSRITYNNFTDKEVRFGFTSQDEMGIIFGYYFED
jgi:hypothetical protein